MIQGPARLRGFDINAGLVRRARGRGIEAEIADLDKSLPGGELAVLWGVLHHLRDFASCLRRVRESYPLVFIREPVRTGCVKGLELGHPLRLKELFRLVSRELPGSQIHFCDGSVMLFYACPGYIEPRQDRQVSLESLLSPETAAAGVY
jgi:hypothetical protein